MIVKIVAPARLRRSLAVGAVVLSAVGLAAPAAANAESEAPADPAAAIAEPTATATPEPTPPSSEPAVDQTTESQPGQTSTPTPTPSSAPTLAPEPGATASPTPLAVLPADPAATVDPIVLPVIVGAPSWTEVTAATGNPVASASLTASLTEQRALLDAQVQAAETAAAQAGTDFQLAQQAADQRRFEVESLDGQVAEAQVRVDESSAALGTMAAHLRGHTGGLDPQVITFFDAGPEDDYLNQATTLNRFADNADDLREEALADQAELVRLQGEAQTALADAEQLAAQAQIKLDLAVAAQNALTAQRDLAAQTGAQIDVMLDVLAEGRAPTVGDYSALLAAQQAAYEAGVAALAAAGNGALGAAGAAVPMGGALLVTDGYGGRVSPTAGASSYHEGLDLTLASGTTQGAVLYAVLGGTVTYAGPMGSYGNVVEIDLGGGTRIRYGHIADGGIGVQVGQQVKAGQPIALAGSTGISTGPHLHFEVRINGRAIDPVPWLRGLKIVA